MRPVLRLLPLPFSIALCLPALAAGDKPESWALCPIEDAIPAFADEPPVAGETAADRAELPTAIEGDQLGGTEQNLEYQGTVVLRRGNQYLNADNLKFDQ